MSNEADDWRYEPNSNEPTVRPLIRKSFVFVPSAGMRVAPEILILELYREIFFLSHCGSLGNKDLNPDEINNNGSQCFSVEEQAVLYTLRGRRRKSPNTKIKPYFAPAYPLLARNGWLGIKRERVINNFLLGGPIAQFCWNNGKTENTAEMQNLFAKRIIDALVGQNSCGNNDFMDKDILSVAIRTSPAVDDEVLKIATDNIIKKTGTDDIIKISSDPLSERIYNDLLALCEMERDIPRMQWMQLLMTFLRFSLPMWLLAHMRITSLLHQWLIDAIDCDELPAQSDIEAKIKNRNQELLHSTLTPTREIFERTEMYMKQRVELNILIYHLEKTRRTRLGKKRLEVQGAGASVITILQLIELAKEAAADIRGSQRFQAVIGEGKLQDFLTREAEQFPAWRDPRAGGQGKNIDEFFRVFYRDSLGDETGGYLLSPEGRGLSRGFRVFPGQLLLKTITILAAYKKHTNISHKGGGKLALENIENHFKEYGIDFNFAAGARPLLMQNLEEMGLLVGSPDAGSSVAVACPYRVGESQC